MIESTINTLVDFVAPKDKNCVSSMSPTVIALLSIPMILLTDEQNFLQIRAAVLLTLNIVVRLKYPSCYHPVSQSLPGIIPSPVAARLIAFVAEFCLYEVWAVWVDVPFWGSANYLWLLVLVGECVSTTALLGQSNLLFNVEDTIWFIHTTYMAYLCYPQPAWIIFGIFGVSFIVYHLP